MGLHGVTGAGPLVQRCASEKEACRSQDPRPSEWVSGDSLFASCFWSWSSGPEECFWIRSASLESRRWWSCCCCRIASLGVSGPLT
ncbi:hypothetical protein NDU88_003065 [Pleurodeles waltl]|uniref:Uncharacterized protein n=1 Tax=Pleurodeles waltl TaxID=8319 RepID=A0AAV7KX58_PLEWA|nr:hypothetical protein NDU88_003065 [Pleurodeles waltl]